MGNVSKILIVNADDLGLSEGVNRGIIEGHLNGIVSSTSALVSTPAAREGIELVLDKAPELGIGLHINLTLGHPLLNRTQIPSLIKENGTFYGVTRGIGSPRNWKANELRLEINTQFERFCDYAGKLPDHLDTHQLVGTFSAPCRESMLDLADEYNLPIRFGGLSFVNKFERDFARRVSWAKHLTPALKQGLSWFPYAAVYDRTVTETDHIEVGFFGAGATLEGLLGILENLYDGISELVCHPGYADIENDSYKQRELELAILTNKQVKQKIKDLGIKLATFSSVKNREKL